MNINNILKFLMNINEYEQSKNKQMTTNKTKFGLDRLIKIFGLPHCKKKILVSSLPT